MFLPFVACSLFKQEKQAWGLAGRTQKSSGTKQGHPVATAKKEENPWKDRLLTPVLSDHHTITSYHYLSVSSKRCSPPKVFRTFWRIFDSFLTHSGTFLFSPQKKDTFWLHFWRFFLTHFWRIVNPIDLVIDDTFSENTFWTIPNLDSQGQHRRQESYFCTSWEPNSEANPQRWCLLVLRKEWLKWPKVAWSGLVSPKEGPG